MNLKGTEGGKSNNQQTVNLEFPVQSSKTLQLEWPLIAVIYTKK
ncbi:MAG: hypothetical protein AWU55_2015 [Halomonadaceae bacterium T82-2]|nr:MAG: hypothetical protein AWU55_2015 [Halomonadaceae bacterium T82-2]